VGPRDATGSGNVCVALVLVARTIERNVGVDVTGCRLAPTAVLSNEVPVADPGLALPHPQRKTAARDRRARSLFIFPVSLSW